MNMLLTLFRINKNSMASVSLKIISYTITHNVTWDINIVYVFSNPSSWTATNLVILKVLIEFNIFEKVVAAGFK